MAHVAPSDNGGVSSKLEGAPGATTSGTSTTHATPALSSADAHHALVSVGILLAFVIISTILAGANPALGHGILALLLVMLLMQGITHVNPVTEWTASHQFVA